MNFKLLIFITILIASLSCTKEENPIELYNNSLQGNWTFNTLNYPIYYVDSLGNVDTVIYIQESRSSAINASVTLLEEGAYEKFDGNDIILFGQGIISRSEQLGTWANHPNGDTLYIDRKVYYDLSDEDENIGNRYDYMMDESGISFIAQPVHIVNFKKAEDFYGAFTPFNNLGQLQGAIVQSIVDTTNLEQARIIGEIAGYSYGYIINDTLPESIDPYSYYNNGLVTSLLNILPPDTNSLFFKSFKGGFDSTQVYGATDFHRLNNKAVWLSEEYSLLK